MEDKRRTIQSLVAGGTSKKFLGKEFTLEKVENMKQEEVEKAHNKYEAIYSSMMTKDLKSGMIYSFTRGLNYFVPLHTEKLNTVLNEDALLDTWLTTTACNIYQTFGSMLVPITTSLKVLQHINIDGRESTTSELGHWGDRDEGEEPQESTRGESECVEEEREGEEDKIQGEQK